MLWMLMKDSPVVKNVYKREFILVRDLLVMLRSTTVLEAEYVSAVRFVCHSTRCGLRTVSATFVYGTTAVEAKYVSAVFMCHGNTRPYCINLPR